MHKLEFKTDIAEYEILGAIEMFNKSYEAYLLGNYGEGEYTKENFFMAGGLINPETDYIEILGYVLSYLQISTNDIVVAVCYDEEENEVYMRCDYSGFKELDLT